MRCCGSLDGRYGFRLELKVEFYTLTFNFSCLPAHQWLNKYTDQAEEQKPFWMPINSSCYLGICQTKKTDKEDLENEEITECKKTQEIDIFDLVNSVWVYLKPSEFAQFAKNNIVGAVMIFSAIFWVRTLILFKSFKKNLGTNINFYKLDR